MNKLILYSGRDNPSRPVIKEIAKALSHYNQNVSPEEQVVFKKYGKIDFRLFRRYGEKPLTQEEIRIILDTAAVWKRLTGGLNREYAMYSRGVTRSLCQTAQQLRPGDLKEIEVVIRSEDP